MAEQIDWDDFARVDIRVATVTAAAVNAKARRPAYILTLDLGELGERASSAQITDRYSADELVGKQVLCVTNFPAKRIAGVRSEVLVLGAVEADGVVVLVSPDHPVANGTPIG